jgi:hypothetical protein
MSELQELEAKIKRLKEEKNNELLGKYQYLVGKCLHRAYTSFEKITAINRVEVGNEDYPCDEISFDCIDIYYDGRSDENNTQSHITFGSYRCDMRLEEIERHFIDEEKFIEAFNNCTACMARLLSKNSD